MLHHMFGYLAVWPQTNHWSFLNLFLNEQSENANAHSQDSLFIFFYSYSLKGFSETVWGPIATTHEPKVNITLYPHFLHWFHDH